MEYYKRPLTTETRFSDLPLHPTVAATLARRGYEMAMPVQAAVLAPELQERDLLVSSQTGSGKTIAFGLGFAPALLAGRPSASDKGGVRPRVLVVAPTRELATQVSNELGWLYADAPVRLASFTGGTPISSDLRRLRSGVDVVVGTPGRLVDLLNREALDLSGIAVLVLDEADEMLDLGFKDDLETLLRAAPEDKRTLMFSATIAGPIARMAATYQKNAQRIDMRPAGNQGHSDINFVAQLVQLRDRFGALVNMLLANPNAKAIVFCRTREGVGELQHKLVAHGFAAVAMAGDRAQGERDRALAALRSGAARILVATNVAARGLDVPDVELVVHGDLPEGTESLTHRSGRTGRAGRKGTSIILADPPKRRRAERLFSDAGVKVKWSSATTQAEAQRAAEDQLAEGLMERLSGLPAEDGAPPVDTSLAKRAAALAERLLASVDERALLAVLLERELQRLPQAIPVVPLAVEPPAKKARRLEDGPEDRRPAFSPMNGRPPARAYERPQGRPVGRDEFVSAHGEDRPARAERQERSNRGDRAELQERPRPRPAQPVARADAAEPAPARAVEIQMAAGEAGAMERPHRAARKAKPEAAAELAAPRAKALASRAEPSGAAGGRPVIFRVNLGADAQAEPRMLLPLICRRGGIDRTAVGSIRVGATSSTFEIAPAAAVAFARAAMRPDPEEPDVRIEAARLPEPGPQKPPRGGGGGLPPRRAKPGARAYAP